MDFSAVSKPAQLCLNDKKTRNVTDEVKQNTKSNELHPYCTSSFANSESQLESDLHLDHVKYELKAENIDDSALFAATESKCKTVDTNITSENDACNFDVILITETKCELEYPANNLYSKTDAVNIDGIKHEIEIEPTILQPPDVYYDHQNLCPNPSGDVKCPESRQNNIDNISTQNHNECDPCVILVKEKEKKHYECSICEKKISSHFSLKRHLMTTHVGVMLHECTVCRKKFTDEGLLKKHMTRHTFQSFECSFCMKIFSEYRHLRRHIYTHTGEKPFQCTICQCRFSQNMTLTRHMRIHTGEKPFNCLICEKKFSDGSTLTKHMRTHTGEKPYACSVCKKTFSQSNVLTSHMRTHTDDKPYECYICKKTFARKGGLTLHVRIHTGERPYECLYCRNKFNDRSHLMRHTTLKHKIEKPFEGTLGTKEFIENCISKSGQIRI